MRECSICKRCFTDDILICPDDATPTNSSIPGGLILDGRYELLRRLGQGSTGVVFKARRIGYGTDCAIKVFLPALIDNDPAGRFRYRPLRIRHRNVARTFEFVATGGIRFLVMELVSGRSLQDMLTEKKILPPDLAVDIADAIGMGLRAAHEEGIVHGDLNPSGIMVPDGKPIALGLKILDFGLAKMGWIEELNLFPPAQTGAVRRSALYKAPEQWLGKEPDARADVYSLGIILFQMLTGRVPFRGPSIPSIRKQHLKAQVPFLASVGVKVPWQFEVAMRHALEKEVRARTPSVEAFLRELQRGVSGREGGMVESKMSLAIEPIPDPGRDLIIPSTDLQNTREHLESVYEATIPVRSEKAPRPLQLDENVQFTVYRPRAVEPEKWYSLFVYAHLSERPPDAPPGTPHPKEEVERKARAALGKTFHAYSDNVADSLRAVPQAGILTFVAVFEGIEFVPDHHTLLWEGPVHELEFKLRVRRELEGQTIRGHLRVYLGIILVGEVSLAIQVNTQQALKYGEAPVALDNPVACYRKIFASYSHSDEAIVEQFEQLVGAFGDKYLRDVRDLRAGEKWDERLEELIREADIFQLFWSKNSMRSKFVRDEWEYALTLKKHNFIRPTFWEVPMPEDKALGLPPAALLRLQFKRVPTYGDEPRTSQNLKNYAIAEASPMPEFYSRSGGGGRGAFGSIDSAPKASPMWIRPLLAFTLFLALGAIAFLIWYLLK